MSFMVVGVTSANLYSYIYRYVSGQNRERGMTIGEKDRE